MAKKKDEQTYAILGAAVEAHKTLGPGFLEVSRMVRIVDFPENLQINAD